MRTQRFPYGAPVRRPEMRGPAPGRTMARSMSALSSRRWQPNGKAEALLVSRSLTARLAASGVAAATALAGTAAGALPAASAASPPTRAPDGSRPGPPPPRPPSTTNARTARSATSSTPSEGGDHRPGDVLQRLRHRAAAHRQRHRRRRGDEHDRPGRAGHAAHAAVRRGVVRDRARRRAGDQRRRADDRPRRPRPARHDVHPGLPDADDLPPVRRAAVVLRPRRRRLARDERERFPESTSSWHTC